MSATITLKSWDSTGERVHGVASRLEIERVVRTIDWYTGDIVGVTLMHDPENWADGSGSLDGGSGLSLMLQDGSVDRQHISVTAPERLEDLVKFLVKYLEGDVKGVFEMLYGHAMGDAEIAALRASGKMRR